MPNDNEHHITLKHAESSSFIELSYDGHIYAGWFYSNRRANGVPIPEARVSQLLRSGAYPAGTSVLSAREFGAVLKRLGILTRGKPKQRR